NRLVRWQRAERTVVAGSTRSFRRWVFFFFQAGDGIRDYRVTGVQTCALPICVVSSRGRDGGSQGLRACVGARLRAAGGARTPRRSEERRVGKEGRARGWTERYKKKRSVWDRTNRL